MTDSVLKMKNENGLHVFTINLDANQDGKGVSPWSIVAIMVGTILLMAVLRKLWQCCKKHRQRVGFALPYQIQMQPQPQQPPNQEAPRPDRLV